MDVGRILKECTVTLKNNPIIIIPTTIVSIFISLLSVLLIGGSIASMTIMGEEKTGHPSAMIGAEGGLMGMVFILGIISMVLGTLSHGVVVAMAKEAIDKGKTSLNNGINSAIDRIGSLIVAAIAVSILVTLGTIIFFLPGLIASLLLMFTFVGIMVGNLGAINAMKKSIEMVKTNFKDSIVLFLVIAVIGLAFVIVSSILNIIPVFGQILGLILMGLYWAYISIILVRAYNEIAKSG